MPNNPLTDEAAAESRPPYGEAHHTKHRDEQLVAAYQANNESAFTELFNRYAGHVRGYIRKHTWYYQDNVYIDELVHIVFVVAWKCLREKGFKDETPGSFRRWLFTIAYLECSGQDRKRSKEPMTTSAMFPDSFVDIPLGALDEPIDDEPEEESALAKLNRVMAKLSPDAQKLMRLVAERVPYKKILEEPEFSKYKSVDSLKKKIYRIRNKFK